jgi:hypothetical protein
MYETVSMAIKINESGETLTSSVVDDVFYILQKCARRARETGAIQLVGSGSERHAMLPYVRTFPTMRTIDLN